MRRRLGRRIYQKKSRSNSSKGRGQTKSKSQEWEREFNEFQDFIKPKGLYLRDVEGDGNCLFRAIADQLDGDEAAHEKYRIQAIDYLIKKKDYFAMFLQDDEDIDKYIKNMIEDGTWGGDFEMVALSHVLGVKFCIHTLDQPPFIVKSYDIKKILQSHTFGIP